MIYLDNASSSWPKPRKVAQAVGDWIEHHGANAGRASHRMARETEGMISRTRKQIANLIGAEHGDQVALLQNVTEAINLALCGLLEQGDHVISTGLTHNSVRRPLAHLEEQGVCISRVPIRSNSWIKDIEANLRTTTRMILVTHGSNVTGEVLPLNDLMEWLRTLRKRSREPFVLVDAAQTAGHIDINVQEQGIDLLAFTGHKGLYGPQGTGGLYLAPDLLLQPLLLGGGGGNAESKYAPMVGPERYEAGTRNAPGIAGLAEGVRFVLDSGLDQLLAHEMKLLSPLKESLMELKGVRILGDSHTNMHVPLLSFTMEGYQSSELALLLDRRYDIAVRAGLHCAPDAHDDQGTTKSGGAVRISLGAFNTAEEIESCILALKELHDEIVW